ncbi:MAG: ion transporter [Patescibacteria group bacterium]
MRRIEKEIVIWDDALMILLALASGVLLALQLSTDPTPTQTYWYNTTDFIIALIFLAEFIVKLVLSKSKSSYFRSNWWYLLASIPVTNSLTQGLRLLRVLRFVRLIRLVRIHAGVPDILRYFESFAKQTHLVYVTVLWLIVVFCSTIGFYSVEHQINVQVSTLFDSLWWVISTITTVGYGDITPQTTGGRIIGMLVMICGIGTTGIFTAMVASFLIKRSSAK